MCIRDRYAGFNGAVTDGDKRSPSLSNFAVFSQLVRSRQDFTKCYQEGDPTSRDNNDLVDTDGGFVRITGANKIVSMINLESNLIVLADNGIWAVSGGNDYGFTATNYKSSKLSSFGCISAKSVVVEGGRVFFWSEDGIYIIAKDNTGALIVNNITEKTIQSFYEEIDNTAKAKARGVYDPVAKRIRWLYKSGTSFTLSSETSELILDTTLTAFYPNMFPSAPAFSAEIVGLFASEPFRRSVTNTTVVVGTDVVLSGTDTVVVEEEAQFTGAQSVRYLLAVKSGGGSFYTIGYLNDVEFRDWKNVDGVGVDAKAFLVTGETTGGDSAIAKQVPYLTMHFERTEQGVTPELIPDNQSGCLIRMQWDWSKNALSNKWGPLQQAYRQRRAQYIVSSDDEYDNGFSVVTSKTKVRGRGRSFALYMETEPYKDCRPLGWNLSVDGNSK